MIRTETLYQRHIFTWIEWRLNFSVDIPFIFDFIIFEDFLTNDNRIKVLNRTWHPVFVALFNIFNHNGVCVNKITIIWMNESGQIMKLINVNCGIFKATYIALILFYETSGSSENTIVLLSMQSVTNTT